MKADLHIHSDVSDGSDTIAQIIEAAEKAGLDAIAITDHDTASHMKQIPETAATAGTTRSARTAEVRVVAGVELSAEHKETKTKAHVLGYNISKPGIITALAQPLIEKRNSNSEKQVEILLRNGYQIDADKLARADGKYLYKQHIMDWLVSTGQSDDMFGEFYKNTFKRGGICDFDIEYIDVFDAVKAIKEAGGLAVLAHPGQQQNFWLIQQLVELGLDGLELNHHSHSAVDRETIRKIASQYGLILTGGSDYHGRYESLQYGIGDILSDESGAAAIIGRT